MLTENLILKRSPIFNVFKNPIRIFSILRITLLWAHTYFRAQKKTNLNDARIIETAMDDRVSPDEQAIYPYLFACLYIIYVAWYMLDKLSHSQYRQAHDAYKDVIREAEHLFLSHPTRMKNRDRLLHPLTRFTQTIDGPTNCFPSLHVALVVLSYQIIKDDPQTDPAVHSAMRKSCIDICRSTMQTKQHSMIDVIGGIKLTEQVYQTHFGGSFEDLLSEVLPELGTTGLQAARAAMHESENLVTLMERLLISFSEPSQS